MPFGDLTVSEGKVVRWLKRQGDSVAANEVIAEIETDKATVEIEAPSAGVLRIEKKVGEVVPMGGRIGAIAGAATLDNEAGSSVSTPPTYWRREFTGEDKA